MAAATHAAFLRAVNLGGRRRVRNDELRALFAGLGFAEVRTFRASGNVVFEAHADERSLAPMIEQALAQTFGFPIAAYVRSAAELRRIVASPPFADVRPPRSHAGFQLALLRRRPSPATREQVLAQATSHDRLAFGRRELFWLSHAATGRSQLNLRAIERLVGPWTMRTMETVEQVVARYLA